MPPPVTRRHRISSRIPDRRGFTLVEIMVVVTIISLLASMSLPAFKRVAQSARASTIANDLRVFSSAFSTQAQQAGSFPPEAAAGVLPPLMVGMLKATSWQRKTPIGGNYNWDFNQNHAGTTYRAVVAITTVGTNRVDLDVTQLTAIDRRIDDGVLTTGNFRRGANNEPIYIIER